MLIHRRDAETTRENALGLLADCALALIELAQRDDQIHICERSDSNFKGCLCVPEVNGFRRGSAQMRDSPPRSARTLRALRLARQEKTAGRHSYSASNRA